MYCKDEKQITVVHPLNPLTSLSVLKKLNLHQQFHVFPILILMWPSARTILDLITCSAYSCFCHWYVDYQRLSSLGLIFTVICVQLLHLWFSWYLCFFPFPVQKLFGNNKQIDETKAQKQMNIVKFHLNFSASWNLLKTKHNWTSKYYFHIYRPKLQQLSSNMAVQVLSQVTKSW